MEGPTESVTAEVTTDDLVAFHRYVGRRVHGRRRYVLLGGALLFLPVLFFGRFLVVDELSRALYFDVLRPLLFLFYVVAVLYGIVIWAGPRVAARQAGSQSGMLGRRRYEASADGFRLESDLIESRIRWPGITEVVEEPEHVFVHLGPQAAYVIPRRAFADAAARARFVDAVRDHLRRVSGSASSR